MAKASDHYARLSASPTLPQGRGRGNAFDVAELYAGPAPVGESSEDSASELDERLRQAYFWIVNHAVISPHYDLEYHGSRAPQVFQIGDSKAEFSLPGGQSYSSFVLIPLLTFALRRRCLLIGGPGRGKTASAILLGMMAGYSLQQVRRAMQHGQPQMTIADLLGNPLPADLIKAEKTADIRIAWREWLGLRVKIIDEYNRIPTRTQSALLTVMGDGYAEIMDQIFECPESAWFLTANDDAGGGTYQVIEALRDRIDVVVKTLHFVPRFLDELMFRIEQDVRPEEAMPEAIRFAEKEVDAMGKAIRALPIALPLRRRLEYFVSQFEFFEPAATKFEYRAKDTARISGLAFSEFASRESGKDQLRDLGLQTTNGLSVRSLMTILLYAKGIAWFRGQSEVGMEDLRNVLPFVLHDRLVPYHEAPFFDAEQNAAYKSDRVGWIHKLWDLSCAEYDQQDRDNNDSVAYLADELAQGLDGLTEKEVERRLNRIERLISEWTRGRKLYGPLWDDLLTLKYLHQRYRNYLDWLVGK
ncbi:MAG: AAA family ATPase [Xanthomonadales bacterium]|nr:AAA family ATPase [Xanthomonadales bacterium]